MGDLGDKLAIAIKRKQQIEQEAKNDINTFVWKGPKEEHSGERVQSVTKMVDATPEQLKDWYNHCISMLFSKDSKNPGRYTLKDIVNSQIGKCTAELCLRWFENVYLPDDTRKKYPRNLFYEDLMTPLNEATPKLTREQLKHMPITDITKGMPEEFTRVSIQDILDGCTDNLGLFDRKHLTLKFILELGIELTPQEMNELTVKDDKGVVINRFEIIRERLNLKPYISLHRSSTGLTYNEFRAMINLRTKKYSDLTTTQLVVLKNKVLLRFLQKIDYQINQWEKRINQLQRVAVELHHFSLLPEDLSKDSESKD